MKKLSIILLLTVSLVLSIPQMIYGSFRDIDRLEAEHGVCIGEAQCPRCLLDGDLFKDGYAVCQVCDCEGYGFYTSYLTGIGPIFDSNDTIETASKVNLYNWDSTKEHMFNDKHQLALIMNPGEDEDALMYRLLDIACSVSDQWQEKSNNIMITLNGSLTRITFFVKDDVIINIDAWAGTSQRPVENLIDLS